MTRTDKPGIVAIGLSHELYDRTFPDYMEKQKRQLALFLSGFEETTNILSSGICFLESSLDGEIRRAVNEHADALLIVPMCYTPGLMSAPALLRTDIPVVIWNTQELFEITEDYDFDTLLMNHVIQGTQDITNILIRGNRTFGMETGHYRDPEAVRNITDWLIAARTFQYAKKLRVGLLGSPGQDMGDFGVDETSMKTRWGPHTIFLNTGNFIEILNNIDESLIEDIVRKDREIYEVDRHLSEETHRTSVKLELALRHLIDEKKLDAFTMNFPDLVADGRLPSIPFLGINKMISEGLGYAGEGNTTIAALMAQMSHLCGGANFTETYTIDFRRNLILMSHMQECNPAFARKDRKVRLIHKDFWANGIGPYAGMHFTLEAGPVTLVNVTTDNTGDFYYICYETEIGDFAPLENFNIPHWFIKPAEDAGSFLTRYSMAGGTHHLVSVPGHHAALIKKLATLQGFKCLVL